MKKGKDSKRQQISLYQIKNLQLQDICGYSGEIKKIKNGYDVNILVLIQYRDTFDDVGNIFASGSQKNPRKELAGGKPFGMETRIKTIRIRKTMKSLDEIKKEVEDNLKKKKNR